MPYGFTMPPASAAEPATVSIALVSNSDRRQFDLHVDGAPVNIGRASRTRGKQLEAQHDNALFDCPVMSRLHAELCISSKAPNAHQVTITDSTSLHGTKVNNIPLQPRTPFVLKPGDKIKLGERVTRGDGVSLTFERIHSPLSNYMSSTADLQPSNTFRGFRAPSVSDASDNDSDHAASYISDGEHHPSSAKTTPEQNKMKKFGTQQSPIRLDDDLSEDITFSRRVPESVVHPALNISTNAAFEGFSDAASVQDMEFGDQAIHLSDADSEIDRVDDVEYDEFEEEDNLSDIASELSSEEASEANDDGNEENFEEDAEEDDEEDDEEEPAYRAPSPELGNFDNGPEVTFGLTDVAGMGQSRWGASSFKHYDPVRSSVAAVEQAPEPYRQPGRTTTTPFTYDYPGFESFPATNFTTSSYWDSQHPVSVYSTAFSKQTESAHEQGLFNLPTTTQSLLSPMSIDSIVGPASRDDVQTPAETVNKTVTAEPSNNEVIPEEVTEINSHSKRKRDEVDDTVDVAQPPAKKATEAPPAPPARRRLSPKKHRSNIRKAVVGATQAAAFAAAGAIGTVAFLSSPMAESLIQWLG